MALRLVMRRVVPTARPTSIARRVPTGARRALAAPPGPHDDDDAHDSDDAEPRTLYETASSRPALEELPQYWRDLESRTVNRKPRLEGPRGRGPRRKSAWDSGSLGELDGDADGGKEV